MKRTQQMLIIKNIELTKDIYLLRLKSESFVMEVKPGQFANIKCTDEETPLLRRPISVCDVDHQNNQFDLVYQVKGKGTAALSKKKAGDRVDVLGPLGNSFDFMNDLMLKGQVNGTTNQTTSNCQTTATGETKRAAIIGGGIGTFPLLYLAKEIGRANIERDIFVGFRNKQNVVLEEQFKNNSTAFYISTDDGSYGHNGFVTDLLVEQISKKKYDVIYCCGPEPMLKRVASIAKANEITCQLSVEQRMGCGIGACLVCACKTKAENKDGWKHSHVCKDGPIFNSSEVIFD